MFIHTGVASFYFYTSFNLKMKTNFFISFTGEMKQLKSSEGSPRAVQT
jgi:hypothetical protein